MTTDDTMHAWLEDRLSPADRATFEATLDDDPSLRARAERLRRARELLRRAGPVATPDGFVDGLMDRLDAAPHRPWWTTPAARAAEGVALVAAAAVVLWTVWPSPPPPPEAPDFADAPVATVVSGTAVTRPVPASVRVDGVPRDDVARIAQTYGATLDAVDGALVLTADAATWAAVEAALVEAGTVTASGVAARSGRVRVQVELAP